eukprot:scaffold1626_cov372-Prasinococcus_capsulatus_cf.AAC.20
MGYESRFFTVNQQALSEDDDGLPTGAIAGIAVAAALAALAVFALIYLVTKEKQGTPLFTPLLVTNTAHAPDPRV